MKNKYLFESNRLGFRNWTNQDLNEFAKINADAQVMKHFPNPLSSKETAEFLLRLQNHYDQNGYCYFATELLKSGELIGFIGLAFQEFVSSFTPATDIGWRLKKSAWGKGYATEGAKRCLEFAFDELKLDKVVSTCTLKNTQSEKVMRKIGMTKKGVFKHPKLSQHLHLEHCIWYEIDRLNYESLTDRSKTKPSSFNQQP